MTEAILIVGDGEVTAVAGGPVPIGDLGSRVTQRLSRVEFCAVHNDWVVTELQSGRGEILFRNPDYDACILWETSHYNQQLKQGINLIPTQT